MPLQLRTLPTQGVVYRLDLGRPPRCSDIDTDVLLTVIASISLAAGGMGWAQSWDIRPTVADDVPWKVVAAKLSKLVRAGLLDGCTCGCRGDFTLTDAGIDRVRAHSTVSGGVESGLRRIAELARP